MGSCVHHKVRKVADNKVADIWGKRVEDNRGNSRMEDNQRGNEMISQNFRRFIVTRIVGDTRMVEDAKINGDITKITRMNKGPVSQRKYVKVADNGMTKK